MGRQEHQKTGVNTNKYITSFMGIAGGEEPEFVILVILYNPVGERADTKEVRDSFCRYTI